MSDDTNPTETKRPDGTAASRESSDSGAPRNAAERADDEEYQSPRLSPEEIQRLEDYEELENFIEEPPEGSLSIISDQDTPGAPG